MSATYDLPAFREYAEVATRVFRMMVEDIESPVTRKLRPETAVAQTRMRQQIRVAAREFLAVPVNARPAHLEELFDSLTNRGVDEEVAARECMEVEAHRQALGRTRTSPLLDRRPPSAERALSFWWNELTINLEAKGVPRELVTGASNPFSIVASSSSLAG